MKLPPVIVVQLVHLQGPFKGQIQEVSENEITIGRHPSCTVKFPADLNIVSRKHADIVRDGNRFKVVDHSANGTYVNGKKIQETYLKNGDVISLSDVGPKISFLMHVQEVEIQQEKTSPPAAPPFQEHILSRSDITPVAPSPEVPKEPEVVIENVQAPLVIQYGPTIRSYKKLPITIGKHPSCDFILNHPAIFDHHAQIFFSQSQYWVKDLTGRRSVLVNRQPVGVQTPLKPEDDLALSPQGPFFRFLGAGRLAEMEDPSLADPASQAQPEYPRRMETDAAAKPSGSFSKRFLRD